MHLCVAEKRNAKLKGQTYCGIIFWTKMVSKNYSKSIPKGSKWSPKSSLEASWETGLRLKRGDGTRLFVYFYFIFPFFYIYIYICVFIYIYIYIYIYISEYQGRVSGAGQSGGLQAWFWTPFGLLGNGFWIIFGYHFRSQNKTDACLSLQFCISFLRDIQRWLCMLLTFRRLFFQTCVTSNQNVDYSFFQITHSSHVEFR